VVVVFYQVDRGPRPAPLTIRAVRLAPADLPQAATVVPEAAGGARPARGSGGPGP
jgi:hypothetical protein